MMETMAMTLIVHDSANTDDVDAVDDADAGIDDANVVPSVPFVPSADAATNLFYNIWTFICLLFGKTHCTIC